MLRLCQRKSTTMRPGKKVAPLFQLIIFSTINNFILFFREKYQPNYGKFKFSCRLIIIAINLGSNFVMNQNYVCMHPNHAPRLSFTSSSRQNKLISHFPFSVPKCVSVYVFMNERVIILCFSRVSFLAPPFP
jgi:hypothetical protein